MGKMSRASSVASDQCSHGKADGASWVAKRVGRALWVQCAKAWTEGAAQQMCRRSLLAILLAILVASVCLGILWNSRSPSLARNVGNDLSRVVEIYPTWDITPRAEMIAIPAATERGSSVVVVDLRRKRDSILGTVEGGYYAAWSHDGTMLVYSGRPRLRAAPGAEDSKIGLFSPESRSLSALPSEYEDRHPVWDAGDSRLAFVRWRFGDPLKAEANIGQVVVLCVTRAALGRARTFSCEPAGVLPDALEWRPLRREVAYVALGPMRSADDAVGRARDIYLLSTTTGLVTKLTDCGDVERYSLSWSPDGDHIAFARKSGGVPALAVLSLATRQRVDIPLPSSRMQEKLRYVKTIRWSPDGRAIAFDACVHDRGAEANLGLIRWPSLETMWLTRDGRSWAPRWIEGDRIAFVRNQNEIWRMSADGSEQRMLWPRGR